MGVPLLQNMALTREHVPDIIDCAAVLGWEKMSHTVVSMSKALVHLRPTPEALASGFLAVAVLQGTLLCSHVAGLLQPQLTLVRYSS